MKATLLEAGTQVFIRFKTDFQNDSCVTMNMFSQNSIDVKIWENKDTCIGQAFIDVDEIIRATELFKELYAKGLIKDEKLEEVKNMRI